MDKFGDYVERPAVPTADATKIFVSSTFEDFGALHRLLRALPDTLQVPVEIYNLSDFRYGKHEWATKAKSSDLLLLFLGKSLGANAPDSDKSFPELDYLHVVDKGLDGSTGQLTPTIDQGDVIIYTQLGAPDSACESSMVQFRNQLRDRHGVVTELAQLSEVLQFEMIHDRVTDWLAKTHKVKHQKMMTLLGERVPVAGNHCWRDYRINDLDQWVFGLPPAKKDEKEDEKKDHPSLVNKASDEMAEASLGYKMKHAASMNTHLTRLAAIRPLDGHGQYWLARLAMIDAATSVRWDKNAWIEVLNHFRNATRIHAQAGPKSGQAGLCHLMQTKALRNLGQEDLAQDQLDGALSLLGWHSETHLEACYLALAAGRPSAADRHLRDAFYKYPPSFHCAEHELADLPGGQAAFTRVRQQLVAEVEAHLIRMCHFERAVGDEIDRVDDLNGGTAKRIRDVIGQSPVVLPMDVLGHEIREVSQSETVRVVGNNAGILAAKSNDPVRLANRAQWLSTLNHQRLVELEKRAELGYQMFVEARSHWAQLADATVAARVNGVVAGLILLVILGFLGTTGILATGVTVAVMIWTLVATIFGAIRWNRDSLNDAERLAHRTLGQLRSTTRGFEELIVEYETTHTDLNYYLPRVAPSYKILPLCRLNLGSKESRSIKHDYLTPHVREAVGPDEFSVSAARAAAASSHERPIALYREVKPYMVNTKHAERWRAYASPAGILIDLHLRPGAPRFSRARPLPPKPK